jgi:hypothetical protein
MARFAGDKGKWHCLSKDHLTPFDIFDETFGVLE